MSLVVGQVIAGFEVTERIGAGGMGEVFRARDLTLGRDVAIKQVHTDVVAHPSRLSRLRREARLLASLSHPAIASIYGLEEVDGTPLLILELIDGPTLNARVRNGPPLGMAEALRLAAQIASGIAAAHAKGIIHRDLKPANIKVQPDGRVKILDFGIAKALEAGDDDDRSEEATVDLTQEGAVFGTAPYMSPEQVRGARVDRGADVWAFGCVVFEMLTGRKAFGNVAAVLEREPDWAKLPQDTPREVRDLLRRCLNKDAARRPADLTDAANLLDDLGVAIGSGRLPARVSPARRWIYGGIAAAAGTAVVVAVMSGQRSDVATVSTDAPSAAPAPSSRPSIAVLSLRNLSGTPATDWLGTALGETMSADLRAGDSLRVIPGERIVTMQKDLELPGAEAYTANTLNRIRGVLGCDFVLIGGYLVSGDRVRADVRVQDARTGALLTMVSVTGVTGDLIDLTSQLGDQLRPALGAANNDSGRATAGLVMPRNAEAARLYADGLSRLRDQDPLAARPLLEHAARLDAQAPLVHLALSRLWSSLGYRRRAAAAAASALAQSAALPWAERTEIEARAAELSTETPKAIELYRQLLRQFPDHLEYGLQLIAAERAGGKTRESLATIETLRRLPPPLGDDARLDLEEGASWQIIGDAPKALAATERGIKKADAIGSRYLLSRGYVALAAAHTMKADYPAAKTAALEAQRMAEAVGDKGTVARSLRMSGVSCWFLSDPDCMVRNSEQALLISREIGDREMEATSLANMAIGEIQLGRTEAALTHEQQALAIRLETDDVRSLRSSRHNLGELYQALARLDEADAAYRQEMIDSTNVGDRSGIASANSGLGDVAAARDDARAARAAYEHAIAVRSELGLKANVAASQLAMATMLIQSGHAREAEPLARLAAETFRAVNDRDREAWATGFLARAQFEQGHQAEARKTLAGARAGADRAAGFRARFTFAVNDAVVRAGTRQPEDIARARSSLDALLAEAVKSGMINRQFEARLELGRVELLSASTAPAGRQRLRQLQRDARARGFKLIARRAAASLTR